MYFMRLSLSDLATWLSLAADLAGPVALGVVLLVIWALFAVIDAKKSTPIDLTLLVGDMFEKNSIAQDKAIFDLIHDDTYAD